MDRRTLITLTGAALASTGIPALAQETAEAKGPVVIEMTMGAADAPVTFMEYGSFTCPHCAAFHAEVMGPLQREYIDTGKVRFVYRELVRNRFDIWASLLARCGGEMRYFGISSMLFEKQEEWVGSGDPAQIADALRRMGKVAGLTDEQLDTCMTDAAMAQAILDLSQKQAEEDQVEGTPTLFIDGERVQNQAWAGFKAILDEKLAQ